MFESFLALLETLQGPPAYLLLFVVLAGCGVGLPVNEDIVLLTASALTLHGTMEPIPLIATAWCGLLCGDALIFHWGHRFGAKLLEKPFMARIVSPHKLQVMQHVLRRRGAAFLFFVRFIPGIRTALFFAAGSLRMRYRDLFLYDGVAALIELPLLVYGVRYVGGRWQVLQGYLHGAQWYLLGGIALASVLWWWRRRKRRGRQ